MNINIISSNKYYCPGLEIYSTSSKTLCHNCPGLTCKSFNDKQLIHRIPTAKKVIKDCATCVEGNKCDRTFKYHRHACLLCEINDCDKKYQGVIHL